MRDNKWGSRRAKDTPVICLDSYRSHEDYSSRKHIIFNAQSNHSAKISDFPHTFNIFSYNFSFCADYPKQSYRKGPRLPECDFDT